MIEAPPGQRFAFWLRRGSGSLLGAACFTLGLHLLISPLYGYHRDELYLLACGKRLAWGAVDHGPMAPAVSRVLALLLGESPTAQRVAVSIAGALVVWLTGLCARQLGGDGRAQLLAAASVMIAPIFIFSAGVHGTNALDQLSCVGTGYLLLRCFSGSEQTSKHAPSHWLLIGCVLGLGLLNKGTVAVYGLAIAIGLLASPLRAHLRTPWPYLAALLALLAWAPSGWWQASHQFLGLEFLREHNAARIREVSTASFWMDQVRLIHPFSFTLALVGLGAGFRRGATVVWRFFAVVLLVDLGVFFLLRGKPYYPAPAYPVLIAAGSVVCARTIGHWNQGRRSLFASAWLLGGMIACAGTLPILPTELVERWKLYRANSELIQFAPWQDVVSQISAVYRRLGGSARIGILTDSYGTAAAVETFGAKPGLPAPLSGANGYFLWGMERADEPDELVAIGYAPELLRSAFEVVERVGEVRSPRNLDNRFDFPRVLWHCRGKRLRLSEFWHHLRRFD